MGAYYFDSSALIKRFTREVGSRFVLNLFRPSRQNSIYTARVSPVEVAAGLSKQC